jgi:hypothetical protein
MFFGDLAYHQTKPEDPRNFNKIMKYLFHDYYCKEKDIKNYCGVEFVEAMLKKIETNDNEKKLQMVSEHVPVRRSR